MLTKCIGLIYLASMMLLVPNNAEAMDTESKNLSELISSNSTPVAPHIIGGKVTLDSISQGITAYIDENGLEVSAGADNVVGSFRLTPFSISKGMPRLIHAGSVSVDGNKVQLTREFVDEVYSSSLDGVRQDFIVKSRPLGSDKLELNINVTGASVETSTSGISIALSDGRRLAYHKLFVFDADNNVLSASMAERNGMISITVDDTGANYPITIDPTISDSDWLELGSSVGADDIIFDLQVDSQQRIYISGRFKRFGGVIANGIVRWSGSRWESLGSGVAGGSGAVTTMEFDKYDNLYIGGNFTSAGGVSANYIAKWDGESWSGFGAGANNQVRAIHINDDGTLLVGGFFTVIGGTSANYVATWNGSSWQNAGSFDNNIWRFVKSDTGDVYASGYFTKWNGISLPYIAKWNGSTWSRVGSVSLNSAVENLTYKAGKLYASGLFTQVGSVFTNYAAVYNEATQAWSGFGNSVNGKITTLREGPDGAVYAVGEFTSPRYAAKWTGSKWVELEMGFNALVRSIQFDNNGQMYVSGSFTKSNSSDVILNRVATRAVEGQGWNTVGDGITGTAPVIYATAVDSKGQIYAAGAFNTASSKLSNNIAMWDGGQWQPLGTGANNIIYSLTIDDNDNVYAAGTFTSIGGVTTKVGKWDGTSWESASPSANSINGSIKAIHYNKVSKKLIVAGEFTSPAIGVIELTSSGYANVASINHYVYSINSDNNGSIYLGGRFSVVNGSSFPYLVKLTNGVPSSIFPSGDGFNSGEIHSIAVSGDGSTLAVSGILTSVNGGKYIRHFSNGVWNNMGGGANQVGSAVALDSQGNVYAGGQFTVVGGQNLPYLAKWDGASWSAVTSFINGPVRSLTTDQFDNIIVGGSFTQIGSRPLEYIAKISVGIVVSTEDATAVTQNGAVISASIRSSSDDVSVIESGFIYSSSKGLNLDSADAMIVVGDVGADGFYKELSNLLVGKPYYYKAYAKSASGVTYGAEKSFVTKSVMSFNTGGGSEISNVVDFGGKPYIKPSDPVREGYSFVGWQPLLPTLVSTGDVEYVAKWSVNQYTLSFLTDGGSAISAITADYGSAFVGPLSPIKAGYTFSGWSPALPELIPSADTSYTAQWTVNQYAISFNTNGGSEVSTIVQSYNSAITAPESPVKSGYSFNGWSPALPATMPAGNLEVGAQWVINAYTISFDTDGGNSISPITQDYNTSISIPVSPTKTGSTFSGWSIPVPSLMPAENITITALWTVNSYTVSFDTDGGSAIGDITQLFGTDIESPAPPTKEGFTFAGWTPALPAKTPASDLLVKASWVINSYTLSFDSAGGSVVESITLDYNQPINVPENPVRVGHTFNGWSPSVPSLMPAINSAVVAQWTVNDYTLSFDSDGGSSVTAIIQNYNSAITPPVSPTKLGYTFSGWSPALPATMPANNISSTALWGVDTYKIAFDSAGGSAVTSIIQDYNSAVTAPASPVRDGYTFSHWLPSIPSNMPAENTIIVAQWDINSYTVSFDAKGGSAVSPITQNFNTPITVPQAPSKSGYNFAGWSPAVPAVMPSNNVNVEALWSINQYSITFDTAGGSLVNTITQDFGTPVVAPAAPERMGYTFAGWSPAIPTSMPSAHTNVTGSWTVNSYTISFDSNGGSNVGDITQNFGTDLIAPAIPVRDGYTFKGWLPALSPTMGANNIVVVGQWDINEYAISFDTGGGSIVEPIKQDYGSAVVAPANPTREGYTFVAWEPSIPSTMPSSSLSIAAKWAVNNYTISFDADGGSAVPAINQAFGTALVKPANPSKPGYIFNGWEPVVPETMGAADLTVMAQWVINKYSIVFDSNGGSAVEPIIQDFDTPINAPNEPTYAGYTFDGWIPAIPNAMPSENITVSAKWTLNQYSVNFDTDGADDIPPISVDFGASIPSPKTPVKAGQTFKSWLPALPLTMPPNDISVKATWETNTNTLAFDTDGGADIASMKLKSGEAVPDVPDPKKKGYTFEGWVPALPEVMPTEDLTVRALWVVETYTITVNSQYKADSYAYTYSSQFNTAHNVPLHELGVVFNPETMIASVASSCSAYIDGTSVIIDSVTENCSYTVSFFDKLEDDIAAEDKIVNTGDDVLINVSGVTGKLMLVDVERLRGGFTELLSPSEVGSLISSDGRGNLVFRANRTGLYSLHFKDFGSAQDIVIEISVIPFSGFSSVAQVGGYYEKTTVGVTLSDLPIEYPVTVTLSSSNILEAPSEVTFYADSKLNVSVDITPTLVDGSAVVSIVPNLTEVGFSVGSLNSHYVAVSEVGSPLTIKADLFQNGIMTSLIAINENNAEALVSEKNGGDLEIISAKLRTGVGADQVISISDNVLGIDTQSLAIGNNAIFIEAKNNEDKLGYYRLAFTALDDCPLESCENEPSKTLPICPGVGVNEVSRVLSCEANMVGSIEVSNGYTLSLGDISAPISWQTLQFGAAINISDLDAKPIEIDGHILNYNVNGLYQSGETTFVSFPLLAGQKLQSNSDLKVLINNNWQSFLVDEKNSIYSAVKSVGQEHCPAIASTHWQKGLLANNNCVRLSVEDGGPNDFDRMANAVIQQMIVLSTSDSNNSLVTISFDTAGGSPVAPIAGAPGSALAKPENPSRKGYTFIGWSVEIPSVIPNRDLVIQAQWELAVKEKRVGSSGFGFILMLGFIVGFRVIRFKV